uniref:hypothetical protein n=3 Tax=Bacillati TaxID=1783272 RepID=UPI0031B5990A
RLYQVIDGIWKEGRAEGFFPIYCFAIGLDTNKLIDILFKRYGNPKTLLETQTLSESLDFFMYLLDEQDKEELTDIWKSKDFDMTLSDFIKKHSKKSYIDKQSKKQQSVDQDKEAIALAESILKIQKKGE